MPTFIISKKLSITFFLIMRGVAFYVSYLIYKRTNISPKKTMRHYNGDEENLNSESEYEYNDELIQEGFFFPK